ncbi:unnamed protein product, partial [Ixodes hexagonus]
CGTLGAYLKSGGTRPSVPSRNPANRPYPSQIYALYLSHRVSAKRLRACSTPACSGGSNATSFSAPRSTGSALDSPLRTFSADSSTIRFPRHHLIFVSWPVLTSAKHLIAFRTPPCSLWRNSLVSTVGRITSLLHSSRIALSPFISAQRTDLPITTEWAFHKGPFSLQCYSISSLPAFHLALAKCLI